MLAGPALGIFSKKITQFDNHAVEALSSELASGIDFVLTATSWASDIERECLQWARREGKYSISYLDHWCNYRSRFECGAEIVLPDEIWVGDEDAYDLAMQCFDGHPIRLVPNPYFQDIEYEFSKYDSLAVRSSGTHVLYVCESIVESGMKLPSGGLIEYESLNLFFKHLKLIKGEDIVYVRLRLHPAESAEKYDGYLLGDGTVKVEKSQGSSLIEDCLWADWVVGMNTMALIVAKIGKRRVGYCNIGGAKPKSLPQTGLVNFLSLTTLKS